MTWANSRHFVACNGWYLLADALAEVDSRIPSSHTFDFSLRQRSSRKQSEATSCAVATSGESGAIEPGRLRFGIFYDGKDVVEGSWRWVPRAFRIIRVKHHTIQFCREVSTDFGIPVGRTL